MKIKLSQSLLRKILIGTTIFNCLLLVTYVFLLISAYFIENYTVFMLSIPAYIFSRSWLLIAGLFGFEICLIIYYLYKNKSKMSLEESTVEKQSIDMLFDEEIIQDEVPIEQLSDFELDETFESPDEIEQVNMNAQITSPNNDETYIEEVDVKEPVLLHAEQEFDHLWKEAIDHVKNANSKKKLGSQLI